MFFLISSQLLGSSESLSLTCKNLTGIKKHSFLVTHCTPLPFNWHSCKRYSFLKCHLSNSPCSLATSGKYVAVRLTPFSLMNSIRIPWTPTYGKIQSSKWHLLILKGLQSPHINWHCPLTCLTQIWEKENFLFPMTNSLKYRGQLKLSLREKSNACVASSLRIWSL